MSSILVDLWACATVTIVSGMFLNFQNVIGDLKYFNRMCLARLHLINAYERNGIYYSMH